MEVGKHKFVFFLNQKVIYLEKADVGMKYGERQYSDEMIEHLN